jgi:hypothetical protein
MGVQLDNTLVTSLKKAHDSGDKDCIVFLIEFHISVKVIRVIKMCLNKTHIEDQIGKICLMHILFRMV